MRFNLGDKVSWRSIGNGIISSRVVALASNLCDHKEIAAVEVHWGHMWIEVDGLFHSV